MGSQSALDYSTFMISDSSTYFGDEIIESNFAETDYKCDNILYDLDSYLDDIKERLTISRMVNESVIKGMVTGIQQEAAQEIAQKDEEIFKLKEKLQFDFPNQSVEKSTEFLRQERFGHTLPDLTLSEQDRNLLDLMEGKIMNICVSSSCEETAALEIAQKDEQIVRLKEKLQLDFPSRKEIETKSFGQVNQSAEKSEVSGLCQRCVRDVLQDLMLSEQDRNILDLMESKILNICVSSSYEETVARFQSQRKDVKEISELRQELDGISKLLSESENGTCFLQFGFDNFRTKNSRLKKNGNHIPPAVTMRDGLDLEHLKDLNSDQLITHFKTEMMKIVRHYEQQIQNVTEEMFSLKRDYLKDIPLQSRKVKGFDDLDGRISEVIQRLFAVLDDCEKWVEFSHDVQSLNHENQRFDSLSSENRQLREMLAEKKKDVLFHSSKVSDLLDQLSRHNLAESKLIKKVKSVKKEKEDVYTMNIISDDILRISLNEAISQLKSDQRDSILEPDEEIFAPGIREILLNEAWKDANEKLTHEISKLVADVNEKDEFIKKLRFGLDDTRDELNESGIIRTQLEKKISTIMKDYQFKKSEIFQLRTELNSVSEEKKMLQSEIERHQERENESWKQFNILAKVFEEFSEKISDFESSTVQNLKKCHQRLKTLDCDMNTLGLNVNLVRKVAAFYKEKFEGKLSDLHKAETEVDLLGDEVDALFNLLEKIYIALDHYSPVLVHYPGITEILNLVRKKLCGEASKAI